MPNRAEPCRTVPGRSTAALLAAPKARLSGCGGSFPLEKSEVKKAARLHRFPPPSCLRASGELPDVQQPARPAPPRPGGGAERGAAGAYRVQPRPRRCRFGRAFGTLGVLRHRVLPSRPSERTTAAAWEEMSVAGKHLERPGSLLVPTWASTRSPLSLSQYQLPRRRGAGWKGLDGSGGRRVEGR